MAAWAGIPLAGRPEDRYFLHARRGFAPRDCQNRGAAPYVEYGKKHSGGAKGFPGKLRRRSIPPGCGGGRGVAGTVRRGGRGQ